MAICGIYKYTNDINGNVYIGQSQDITARKNSHKNDALYGGKDENSPFHRAIRKYGIENFSFEILEECNKKDLNEREKYWINFYNSYHKGYNATSGGDHCEKEEGRPVLLYDLNGNFIKEIHNIAAAARELNVSYNTVYGILKEERKSTKGYQIRYKESDNFPNKIEPYASRQGGSYTVLQLDKNNNILNEYKSVNEAARQTGCDCSTISKVCRGKLKTHGGFKWKYKEVDNK